MIKESKTNPEELPKVILEYIAEAHFQGQITDLPHDLQELFELLLETEQANDKAVRIKMLHTLHTVRDLAKAIAPFTHEELMKAIETLQKS